MEENNSKNIKKNNKYKKSLIIIGIVIVFIFSNIMFFYIGNVFAFNGLSLKSVSKDVAKDLGDIKDVKKYDLLFQVRDALLAKYDGEIDDDTLLEAAIKGMTQSLNDPYTIFMNSDEYKSFVEVVKNEKNIRYPELKNIEFTYENSEYFIKRKKCNSTMYIELIILTPN